VTIQFREFGVKINFLPRITPRNTIRLQVTPEVSSLDYANGLVFQGYTIPGLNTRRIHTEIELEDRQSFVIGGLLDNRVTENLSKIPGLGDIPLLGKLFQSKSVLKNNTELLVLITPEVVRPIPAGQARPDIRMPVEFMKDVPQEMPRTPGVEVTGPAPAAPRRTIPVERLIESQKAGAVQQQSAPSQYPVQVVPVPVMPNPPTQPPATQSSAGPSGGGRGD
jgi:pilus assembly protein CpaC